MYNRFEQGWPAPILDKSTLDRKARIAIRGVFGQLGARLAGALGKQPDLEATIGIVRNDPTVKLRGLAVNEGNPNIQLMVGDETEVDSIKDQGVQVDLW